jgi:hypothetical protein
VEEIDAGPTCPATSATLSTNPFTDEEKKTY